MDARRLEWMRRQMPLTEWQIEATAKLDGVRLALSHHRIKFCIKTLN